MLKHFSDIITLQTITNSFSSNLLLVSILFFYCFEAKKSLFYNKGTAKCGLRSKNM